MNVQDHTTHITPSGHENHGVHICRRCGWPFPNLHPSARHRRSHKKVCGTVEGYTNLNGSDVVSDDEHHPDDDKEKTPSPKIEKKISIGGSGIRGSFSRSEEDLFSDAVTEFSDSGTSQGSAHKTLDRDLFFSFNDTENGGTTEVLNAPVEISKVDANLEVSEKIDTDAEEVVETEITKLELTETDGQCSDRLVKDEVVDPTREKSSVSQSLEAESIDVVVAREQKVEESQTIETKDSESSKTTPEVSAIVGGYDDNVKPEIESVCESASEVKESKIVEGVAGISEEIKVEKLDREITSEVKESKTVEGVAGISEEIKVEKIELDGEITSEVVKESELVSLEKVSEEIKYAPEVTKESELRQKVLVVNEKEDFGTPKEQILEVVKEPVVVLSEIKDFEAPELEKGPKELILETVEKHTDEVVENPDSVVEKHTDEVVEKPDSVVEKPYSVVENPDSDDVVEKPDSVVGKHTNEVVENPDSVVEKHTDEVEKPDSVVEKHTDEVVEKPDSDDVVEKPDSVVGKHTDEVVENPDSVVTASQDLRVPIIEKCSEEIVVEEPVSVLTERQDLVAPELEKCSKEISHEVIEQKVDDISIVVHDVSGETVTQKDSLDTSVANDKAASGVITEPNVEETNDKLINNQDSGAAFSVDSSSRNSVEGNWGSVSVLSTASIDAESLQTTEKSKANPEKSVPSDTHSLPSFMTLVKPEGQDNKVVSSEVQDLKQPLTKVNNESEVRNKNEEAIAKVTNWSTPGKQSTPLKNLLGEAKSPSGKQLENVEKNEGNAVNEEVHSPPKLIDDGKSGRKKAKGKSSWMPFVCCSSVNVVN